MSAPALPTICPRCLRRLVRNHDELVCLTHGQVFEPIRAWETATSPDIDTPFGRQPRTRSPTAVPWTNEERDLWRRAEAGEEFAPPVLKEEKPMSEFTPKGVDDLGGPALARLRELAAQVEKADALAHSLRAEALRFVQVLDLLGVDFPEQLRVVARAKASHRSASRRACGTRRTSKRCARMTHCRKA
jgi:hypothetical protein